MTKQELAEMKSANDLRQQETELLRRGVVAAENAARELAIQTRIMASMKMQGR